jgi:hypothetical protein
VELDQEPVQEAPDLDALHRVPRQEAPVAHRLAARVVEVLGHDPGPGHGKPILVDEERKRAARVDLKEGKPPLPRLLLQDMRSNPHFGQDQTGKPRLRAEGIGVQDGHERV